MPELPEVESVVRALHPNVVERTVVDVRIHTLNLRKMTPLATLQQHVLGHPIEHVRRRAKWPGLVFPDGVLWMHLGMTGQILVGPVSPVGPHDHLDLGLDSGEVIRFHDPRRFGMIVWTNGVDSEPPSPGLGVEPLSSEFTVACLRQGLRRSKKAIKPLLMDGHIVAGVGNIYASEALFQAKIHPDTPAADIGLASVRLLHASIVDILAKAIAAGGSTLRDYRKPDGSMGMAQTLHRVYGRAGLPCSVCGTPISMGVHAGRSTFWCDKCQVQKKIPS